MTAGKPKPSRQRFGSGTTKVLARKTSSIRVPKFLPQIRPPDLRKRKFWIAAAALFSGITLSVVLIDWFGLAMPGEVFIGTPTTEEREVAGSPQDAAPEQTSAHRGSDGAGQKSKLRAKDRSEFPVAVPPASQPGGTAESPAPSPSQASATPSPSQGSPTPTPSQAAPEDLAAFVTAVGSPRRVGKGPLIRYQVEVEKSLPYGANDVGKIVHTLIGNKRGWASAGWGTFERVDRGPVDLRILFATAETTEELCKSLDSDGDSSCRGDNMLVLNAEQWDKGGDETFGKSVSAYRAYQLNHELGHYFGKKHASCTGLANPAPVMMEQLEGVGKCSPNPWPVVSELARD
jgi:hypothetical protein